VAASVAEALSVFQRDFFDVVLSDIGMPELDGYDFVVRLRELERATGRGPVSAIALTAYAAAEDRRRALAAGFQSYLTKPIDPVDLVRAVRAGYVEARSV
jgi:CheY-like chemotaxis protein